MRQPMRRRLVTALFAAGLVGGLVLGSPSALAQPDVLRHRPRRSIRPSAAPPPVDPFAPPPPAAVPLGGPAATAAPPTDGSGALRRRSAAADPGSPAAAHGDPRGHARRPEPDAVHR